MTVASSSKFPIHIGIIPDGARRWARLNDALLEDSYRMSMGVLIKCLTAAIASGASEVSVFMLSKDNLQRPLAELDALYVAFGEFRNLLLPLIACGAVSTPRIIGRPELLPPHVLRLFSFNEGCCTVPALSLNLLVAYSVWDELTASVSLCGNISMGSLWVTSPVNVILRTGGTPLLSGFLPIQSQYAHLSTFRELFNDLTDEQINMFMRTCSNVRQLKGL